MDFSKFSAPIIVDWEITSQCTYRCFFCQTGLANQKQRPDCSFSEKITILKKLAQAQVFSVFLSGGDPLLYDEIVDLYKACCDFRVHPTLSTNGFVVDFKKLEQLQKLGLDAIQLSLQGCGHTHDTVVDCKGSYSVVLNNISQMSKMGLNVKIAFVGTKDNIEDLPPLIEEVAKTGVSVVRLLRFIPCYDKTLLSRIPDEMLVQKIIEQASIKAEKLGVSFLCSACPGHCDVTNETLSFVHPSTHFCPAGKTRFSISSDGAVFPCVILKDEDMYAGSLLTDSVEEIWSNETMAKFRNLTPNDYTGMCSKCDNKWLCYSCRGLAWSYMGSLYEDDLSCYYLESKRNMVLSNVE
ncbi:MAG: hypothetical protein DRP65_00895 [Planctomycetota bacterium]|nr:MAG: hypothetical protein DRP65_00895 [Planctomycetota bacterium]